MKYLKFLIILVIPVYKLTLPLTLPNITLHLTLPYLTLPYLTLPYHTLFLTIPYYTSRTLPLALP